jgi:adenine-specific DNA-methyltransferase
MKTDSVMPQRLLPFPPPKLAVPTERKGVIYTKPWVVELLLNLAGYVPSANLVDSFAVEPAAGQGAFLVPMARRLIASCLRQGRSLADCKLSLAAFEIDDAEAALGRIAIRQILEEADLEKHVAERMAGLWIRTGDYLLQAADLPPADFVMGNPPYVRLEDMPPETIQVYREMYPTMRGRADLYVGFFEASLRQLKENGVCAFICADRWMLNQYGAELRQLVTRDFSVEAVLEMHNANAFDSEVNAYPAITVIRRAAQGPATVGRIKSNGEDIDAALVAESFRTPIGSGGPAVCVKIAVVRIHFGIKNRYSNSGKSLWHGRTAPTS